MENEMSYPLIKKYYCVKLEIARKLAEMGAAWAISFYIPLLIR